MEQNWIDTRKDSVKNVETVSSIFLKSLLSYLYKEYCPLTTKSLKTPDLSEPFFFFKFRSHVFTSQSALCVWWATHWAVSRGNAHVCRLASWLMQNVGSLLVEKPPQLLSLTSTWLLFASCSWCTSSPSMAKEGREEGFKTLEKGIVRNESLHFYGKEPSSFLFFLLQSVSVQSRLVQLYSVMCKAFSTYIKLNTLRRQDIYCSNR